MLEFYLDRHDGTSPYGQLAKQVRQALILGVLEVGDQLPTVKSVVGRLTLNPNTVLKAYRELEHEGLVETRPGVGTFVVRSLALPPPESLPELRRALGAWISDALAAGVDREGIAALFAAEMRQALEGVRA